MRSPGREGCLLSPRVSKGNIHNQDDYPVRTSKYAGKWENIVTLREFYGTEKVKNPES